MKFQSQIASSMIIEPIVQPNNQKVIELLQQFDFQSLENTEQQYSIDIESKNQQYIILIINSQQSENKLSLINYLSNGQQQITSNIKGIQSLTINHQQKCYHVVQLSENVQETQDQDFACVVWLNTLLKHCKHLWIVLSYSYDLLFNKTENMKLIDTTIDLLTNFVKLDCISLDKLNKYTNTLILASDCNTQKDFYIKFSNNLTDIKNQIIQQKKENYKLQYIDHLIKQNNIMKNSNSKSINNLIQFQQQGWLGSIFSKQDNTKQIQEILNYLISYQNLNQQQISSMILYQLSPKTNAKILNFIEQVNQLANNFFKQKDFTNLVFLFQNLWTVINITQSSSYRDKFVNISNTIQQEFLDQQENVIKQVEDAIFKGQQLDKPQIIQIQQILESINKWNEIVTPTLKLHQIKNEIATSYIENKLEIVCKNKLNNFNNKNSYEELQDYQLTLIILKSLIDYTQFTKLTNVYQYYLNILDQQIQNQKKDCIILIKKLFSSNPIFAAFNMQQLNEDLSFINKYMKLMNNQINQSSTIQNNICQDIIKQFQEQLTNYLKYMKNTIEKCHDFIRNNQIVQNKKDFAQDAKNLKNQIQFVEIILKYKNEFCFLKQVRDFQEIKNLIVGTCNEQIDNQINNHFLKKENFQQMQYKITLLIYLSDSCQSVQNQCKDKVQKMNDQINRIVNDGMKQIQQQIKNLQGQTNHSINNDNPQDLKTIFNSSITQLKELMWLDSHQILDNIFDDINFLVQQSITNLKNLNQSNQFQWAQIGESFQHLGIFSQVLKKEFQELQSFSMAQQSSQFYFMQQKEQQQKQDQLSQILVQSQIQLKPYQQLENLQNILKQVPDASQLLFMKLQALNLQCETTIQEFSWQNLTNFNDQGKYIQNLETIIFQAKQLKYFDQNQNENQLYSEQMKSLATNIIGSISQNGFIKNLINKFQNILTNKDSKINLNKNSSYINFQDPVEILRLIQFFDQRRNKEKEFFDFYKELQMDVIEKQLKFKLQQHWDFLHHKYFFGGENQHGYQNMQYYYQKQMETMSKELMQFFPEWSQQLQQSDKQITEHFNICTTLSSKIQNLYYNCNCNQNTIKEIIDLLHNLIKYKENKQNKNVLSLANATQLENELSQQLLNLFELYEKQINKCFDNQNFAELESHYIYYKEFIKFKIKSPLVVFQQKNIKEFLDKILYAIETIPINYHFHDTNNKTYLKKVMKSLAEVTSNQCGNNQTFPNQGQQQQQEQQQMEQANLQFNSQSESQLLQDPELTKTFQYKVNQIMESLDVQIESLEKQFDYTLDETILSNMQFILDMMLKPFKQQSIINKQQEIQNQLQKMNKQLSDVSNTQIQDIINPLQKLTIACEQQQIDQINQQIITLKLDKKKQKLFPQLKQRILQLFKDIIQKTKQEFNAQHYIQANSYHQVLQTILLLPPLQEEQNTYLQDYTDLVENLISNIQIILTTFSSCLKQINQEFNQQLQYQQKLTIQEVNLQLIEQYFQSGQFIDKMQICSHLLVSSSAAGQLFQNITKQKFQVDNQLFDLLHNTIMNFQQEKQNTNPEKLDQILSQLKVVDSIIKYIQTLDQVQINCQSNKIFKNLLEHTITVNYATAVIEVSKKLQDLQKSFDDAWKNNNFQLVAKTVQVIGQYQSLIQSHSIVMDQINMQTKLDDIKKSIENKVADVIPLFDKVSQIRVEDAEKPAQKLRQQYLELLKMAECFKNQQNLIILAQAGIQSVQDQLRSYYEKRSKDFLQQLLNQNNQNYKVLAQTLVQIGQIGYHISQLKDIVFEYIDQRCLNANYDYQLLFQINSCFFEMKSVVGSFIVEESNVFQNVRVKNLRNLTKDQNNPEYVLKNTKLLKPNQNNELQKEYLKDYQDIYKVYETYEKEYQKLIERFIVQLQNKGKIAEQIKKLGKIITDDNISNIINININEQENLQNTNPQLALLVNITVFWSLMQIKNNKPIKDEQGQFIFKIPHASQIFAVMFLLGFDNSIKKKTIEFEQQLENQLAQIKTGQGKSIILGLLAAYLAILNYQVDVVCYSKYLSERDYSDFEEFFKALGIQNVIKYSTFTELSNDIINESGNIRDLSLQLLQNNLQVQQQKSQIQKKKRILLIDEVDVFFSKDFYGQTYNPMASLKSPEITYIMEIIWSHRHQEYQAILDQIFQSQEYLNLINNLKPVEELIDTHIRMMVTAARKIDEHKYEVQNGKIGYKIMEQVSTQISYGYFTNFAHFKEFDSQKISLEEKANVTCINLGCGFYSYAEAPKKYSHILGVTGTLRSLHPESIKIIRKNYINKLIKIPSMYGKSKLKFNRNYGEDIFILPDYDQFEQKIREKAVQKANNNRAVLIFFQDQEHLQAFSKKSNVQTLIIDQNTSNFELKDRIIKATTKSQIVLIDRIFGRGTDFICRDPEVIKNDGVVVIQTFLSMDKSEEKQIKGRTARQSQQGEYFLILLQSELEHNLLVGELQLAPHRNNTMYKEVLDKYRNQIFGKQLVELNENLTKSVNQHEKTIQYQNYLVQNDINKAFETLISFNKQNYHYILCLDDSGSMAQQRWNSLMQVLQKFVQQKSKYQNNNSNSNSDIFTVIFYSATARIIAKYASIRFLYQTISNAKQEHQNTMFYTAAMEIYNVLDQEQLIYKSYPKRVLFLTDGEDCEALQPGERIGKQLREKLQKINDQYKESIQSWWNLLIGNDSQNTQVLEEMTKLMLNCRSKFIKAANINQIEEEILNLAVYNL